MTDTNKILLGWVLGILSSVIVFYIQRRVDKIKKIKNLTAIFEALRDDWNNYSGQDNLTLLESRTENLIEDLNKLITNFTELEDKNLVVIYFKLKQKLKGHLKETRAGRRGVLGNYKEDIDEIFNSDYLKKLHDKYCNCNLKLHNLY